MRTCLIIFFSCCVCLAKAQLIAPIGSFNNGWNNNFAQARILGDSGKLQKKWFVSSYSGISTGLAFSQLGNYSFVAAPIGIQLNRRLNNNLYAFTNASIAPAYFNLSRFSGIPANKNYPGSMFNGHSFGLQTSIAAGLMYVNDDRTFSISGSIGVGTTQSPFLPANTLNKQQQPVLTGQRR